MNWNRKAGVRLGLAVLSSVLLVSAVSAQVERNSLAQTPPMGWNSWKQICLECQPGSDQVRGGCDRHERMKDAGYQYVVIDDCWQVSRDENGFIVADPQRFPSGIKALGGLCAFEGIEVWTLLGRGAKTCAGTNGQPGAMSIRTR